MFSVYDQNKELDIKMLIYEPREFDRFHDYFGLARFVTPAILPPPGHPSLKLLPSPIHTSSWKMVKKSSKIKNSSKTKTSDSVTSTSTSCPEKAVHSEQTAWCVSCKNNGESEEVYTSHVLKNSLDVVACPRLRAYTCPLCGVNGDTAHTVKYCPSNLGSLHPAPVKTQPLGVYLSSRFISFLENRISI